jgi:hypothetical protein
MCVVCVQLGVAVCLRGGDALPLGRGADGTPVDCAWPQGAPCGEVDVVAAAFLADTLDVIAAAGTPLVPVRVDGDGYCLTCAASRALVGSEVLYRALRAAIRCELTTHAAHYAAVACSEEEVAEAIRAADPTWAPRVEASPELHLAALAGVLRRPVVRLSSLACPGFGATFLPSRPRVAGEAPDSDAPLLLGWQRLHGAGAGAAPVHYTALLRAAGAPPPVLPPGVRPPAWPFGGGAGDAVRWRLSDAVDACAPANATLPFAAFSTTAAYETLLTSLCDRARSEAAAAVVASGSHAALLAPPGAALVATDALLRLFYAMSGVEQAVLAAAEAGTADDAGVAAAAAQALAVQAGVEPTFNARVCASMRELLAACGDDAAARAALETRTWLLAAELHRTGADDALQWGAPAASALQAAASALAARRAAAAAAAADAAAAAWAAAGERPGLARVLARTDSSEAARRDTAAAPPPRAVGSDTPQLQLGPSRSAAAAQARLVTGDFAAAAAAGRASRLVRLACTLHGLEADAASDAEVAEIVALLCDPARSGEERAALLRMLQ